MVEVVGFGLAGAAVALALKKQEVPFYVVAHDHGGSSQIAAGLVNPLAGRNFEPGWRWQESWNYAREFYRFLEEWSGRELFHDTPILRLWYGEKDREKFEKKKNLLPPTICEVNEQGVLWKGGGWLDIPAFLEVTKDFLGMDASSLSDPPTARIFCTGAEGLLSEEFRGVDSRCAKGEMLTVEIKGWNETRILSAEGWIIPLGKDRYRVGATYVWDDLSCDITVSGREKIERVLRCFTHLPFTIIDQVSGIRPIVQNRLPIIIHQDQRGWMLNGLGSKGVVYAPILGRELVSQMLVQLES